jgi:general secretion pathway protein G
MYRHRGLTLVEVLIVITVLGIIASVVVPQLTSAGTTDKIGDLKTNLRVIRDRLETYRLQHMNNYPTSPDTFDDQMTKASRADGTTSSINAQGYNLGPYLLSIPNNPFTNANTIGSGPVGTSAWYYDSKTGHFRANHHEGYLDY